MRTPRRMTAAAAALALILPISAVLASPAAADHGNNGTVKVDEQALDGGPGENGPGAFNSNDPHIDCTGRIEWYGFDEGQQDADILFEVWNPTLQTGDEDAEASASFQFSDIDGDGPGGTELDGFMNFDLSDLLDDYEAHPQQGFHVKVTVHTTASQGADVKHKVFWVAPCEDVGGEDVVDEGDDNGDEGEEGDDVIEEEEEGEDVESDVITNPTPPTQTPPTETPTGETSTDVMGNVVTRPSPTPAVSPNLFQQPRVLGVQQTRNLPRTGDGAVPLAALGLSAIFLGLGLTMASRRRLSQL